MQAQSFAAPCGPGRVRESATRMRGAGKTTSSKKTGGKGEKERREEGRKGRKEGGRKEGDAGHRIFKTRTQPTGGLGKNRPWKIEEARTPQVRNAAMHP